MTIKLAKGKGKGYCWGHGGWECSLHIHVGFSVLSVFLDFSMVVVMLIFLVHI